MKEHGPLHIYEWNDEYDKVITSFRDKKISDLSQALLNEMKDFEVFNKTKKNIDFLVAPFDMKYGDELGGFATGTKWHNEDKTMYLAWNTWWNFLTLTIKKDDKISQYLFYHEDTRPVN